MLKCSAKDKDSERTAIVRKKSSSRAMAFFCRWTFPSGSDKVLEESFTEDWSKDEMKKSALFFDIDGTVLSEITKEVPQSAAVALEEARRAGHLIFINTGRTVCSIPSEIRRLRFDGYLCGCGTCLLYEDEVLFSRSLSKERGQEIIRKMMECDMSGIAEGHDDVYFPSRISRFDGLESTRRYFRSRGMGMEQPMEDGGFIYDKLFVYRDERSDFDAFLSFIEKDMEAIDRGDNTYEVIQKGYSKATACEFILEKLGISREQAYVFGDSSNDLAMFQFADHAVAMGKHDPVLDPYTEFVTSTVEDDGIARALRHYGLIG